MAGLSLKCGDCGALLKSVEEAQEHAELTSHSNFSESTEAVLNLICNTCGKPCRSKTLELFASMVSELGNGPGGPVSDSQKGDLEAGSKLLIDECNHSVKVGGADLEARLKLLAG
ncbi:hypothetical protein ACLOJK_009696 [Asimina triloba]